MYESVIFKGFLRGACRGKYAIVRVCYKVCYIILIALLIVAALAHITKTQKTALTYWLEMVAFIATFTTIIVECCILL